MQLLKSCLNAIRREGVGSDHGLGDILLQLFQENLPLGQNLVDCLDRDFLQQELVDRPVSAVHLCGARLQAADAAPDDGFAAVVVPMDAPVKLAAFSAENHLGKTVIAGKSALFPGRADVDCPPAHKLCLHLHKEVFRDDGLMVALDIILWHGAIVLDALLCQEVRGVGFLQKGITHVLLVAENLVDGAGVPLFLTRSGEDAICHKAFGDFIHA